MSTNDDPEGESGVERPEAPQSVEAFLDSNDIVAPGEASADPSGVVSNGLIAIDAALVEPDEARRRSFLLAARIELARLLAQSAELSSLNTALRDAARRLMQLHAGELCISGDALRRVEREAAEQRAQAEDMARQRERALQSLREAAQAEGEARGAREQAEAARERSDAALQAADARLAAERAQAAATALQLADACIARDAAREELMHSREAEAALRASTSWRATAPLRAVAGWLRLQ